jgi:hypothetical protein
VLYVGPLRFTGSIGRDWRSMMGAEFVLWVNFMHRRVEQLHSLITRGGGGFGYLEPSFHRLVDCIAGKIVYTVAGNGGNCL